MAGHGAVVAEFFDAGESRTLAWARRPQAAALVAALADPDRGWDAIVIGEYERAFYGGQYASMAPLFAHYGVKLWLPEAGGPVGNGEDHEQLMLALGLQSKREVTRTRIRVRTAMATQTREQGRYLGGRPPYGYRLADAGPHPNKAHAAWGRRAHRLEPDPSTAPVVAWMFAQRLSGRSAARITRALNDAGIPCPLRSSERTASPHGGPQGAGHIRGCDGVTGKPGIDLDGDPPVFSGCLLVNRGKGVTGGADVIGGDREDGSLRAGTQLGQVTQLAVIPVALRQGRREDRGIRSSRRRRAGR